ncbi:MAG: ribonuclease HI [Bdellovibrionia bacterium]
MTTISPPTHPLATIIFADGASSGNPGPGGWGSIVVLGDGTVIEMGGRDPHTTNNRMELMAVIQPLRDLKPQRIDVFTDSSYVIRGITQWIWAWMKRNWVSAEGKDVANADLWKQLLAATRGHEIQWKFVKGHAGIPGNERVDEIAVAFSKGRRPQLYRGPLLKYDIAIHDIPENTSLPDRKPLDKTPKAKAYSYLSLVGGVLMRHSTWPECEKRVKGRPGTKFKKAMSEDEEIQILRTWGYTTKDVQGN